MFRLLSHAVLIAGLLLAGSAPSRASEAPVDCVKVDKAGGTQSDMDFCQVQKFATADAELNKVYGQLRQRFQQNHDTEAEMLMVKAQRAWVTWRAAEGELCAQSRGFSRGGSSYDTVTQSCETDLTRERVGALRKHLREVESH